jgi:FAD:protein FMN transferase
MSRRASLAPRRAALLLALVTLAPLSTSAGEPTAFRSFSDEVMTTRFELRLRDQEGAEEAAAAVFALFDDVDEKMNEWKDGSPLATVNREAGVSAVQVPDDLRAVVRRGIAIGQATSGAFDITWAALWGLWDFKADTPSVPDPDEVARRAALVDYRQVRIDAEAGTVMLARVDMKIGLGGIAKGWALDRAATLLRARGFDDFLLQGGGQVYAAGDKGGGVAWRVGVRDPRGPAEDFFAVLEARDVSVSTSGDYERFFVVDGRRFHHILDPRTGMPAPGLRSATVVSADATLADAMSTALIVLGVEAGLALIEADPALEAVLVDGSGRVHVSSGLLGRVHRVHEPIGPSAD